MSQDSSSLFSEHPVELFKAFYETEKATAPNAAGTLYAVDVVFEDPIQRLQGLEDLQDYLARFNEVMTPRHFAFGEQLVGTRSAMLTWTMELEKKGSRRGIIIPGVSHIRFGARVTHHRNYYDPRPLVRSKVSLLQKAARLIQRR